MVTWFIRTAKICMPSTLTLHANPIFAIGSRLYNGVPPKSCAYKMHTEATWHVKQPPRVHIIRTCPSHHVPRPSCCVKVPLTLDILDVLRLTAAPVGRSYEVPAPCERILVRGPSLCCGVVRLLVSPFLWPCIHIFVPKGSWLVCLEWFGLSPRTLILSRRHPSSMFSC